MKKAFIRLKDTAQNLMDDSQISPSEYAEDQTKYVADEVVSDVGHGIKKETDKIVDRGRKEFREYRKEKKLERQERRTDEALRRFSEETQAAQSTRPISRFISIQHECSAAPR